MNDIFNKAKKACHAVSSMDDDSRRGLLSDPADSIVASSESLLEENRKDLATEHMDYKMAVRTVDSLQEALDHIALYESGHTIIIAPSFPGRTPLSIRALFTMDP